MISSSPEIAAYASYSGANVHIPTGAIASEVLFFPPEVFADDKVERPAFRRKLNQSRSEPPGPAEWTPELESKFARMAERNALSQLNLHETIRFEKLSALRRQLRNPRKGEEVMAEYEQRVLTHDLVNALSKYVHWHAPKA